jgi:hexosaminidase
MWGEQIYPETVDSRVWPRTLAIAERFWSSQADRDVEDMYRRLRIAALELEDAGLTHISGPQKLRRNLWSSAHPESLEVLASVVEPVSFSDRYQGQHTDALSSLDKQVDAVVPDPPTREEIAQEINEIVTKPHSDDARSAESELRKRFMAWQKVSPELEAAVRRTARLSDIETRAQQLGALGTMGLEALADIDEHTGAPAGWKDAQIAAIDAAGKPSGLVRFVFLPAMRKLVEAAAAAQP